MKSPHEQLALTRLATLSDFESRNILESKGLGTGEGDLAYVFPRTARAAALYHAASAASQIFDERVKDKGVYHLFRLPATWEAQIHTKIIEPEFLNSFDDPCCELNGVCGPLPEKLNDGPVNLKSLDLNNIKHLRKLASTHAAGIRDEKLVIPFFTIE